MSNVNVASARDSHMAMPGVDMAGYSQGHDYQGLPQVSPRTDH